MPAWRALRHRTAWPGPAPGWAAAPMQRGTTTPIALNCLIPSIQRFDQALVGGHRILGAGDRAPDHQMGGAAAHRLPRRNRTNLIVGGLAHSANPRHDDPRIRTQRFREQSYLLPR